MAALRSLLEVYGALDLAVTEAGDAAVADTANGFLPGASTNTGWYSELETLFFGADARQSPNFVRAIDEIEAEELRPESDADRRPLTAAQKSRLFYATSALARVDQSAPRTTFRSFNSENTDFTDALRKALALVGPGDVPYATRLQNLQPPERSRSVTEDVETEDPLKTRFLDELAFRLPNRDNFYAFRAFQADNDGLLDPSTLGVPVCHASVIDVCGTEAVVVDTECDSDAVSLDELKDIVNPFNWCRNYDEFFCDMARLADPERPDGWRRVLEFVGFCPSGGYLLKTALKYHTAVTDPDWDTDQTDWARVDYDLEDPCPGPGGDGLVTVDRGYINMWARNGDPEGPDKNDPKAKGVRVRTRKVVHINGISPYAQARLVCITGYGTASGDFLIGAAENPPNECKPFDHYDMTAPQTPPGSDQTSAGYNLDGSPRPADHAVTTAVKMVTDALGDIGTSYFNLVGKWSSGQLSFSDVTDHYRTVTGKVVAMPAQYLDTVSKPRYPGTPKPAASQDPSSPKVTSTLQKQEDMWQALLHELKTIIDQCTDEDKAGKWGVNGWVRTIHDLIDLQVRTAAFYWKAGVSGPCFADFGEGEPWPSERIYVTPVDAERTIAADDFTRLGLGSASLSSDKIGFRPERLSAGADHFEVYIKDECFIGSNYRGKVVLSRCDGANIAPDTIQVTVGL